VSQPSGESAAARITLIGRDGCHLCDDAREVVRRVADDTGAGWVEVDVDDDPDLLRRYSEQVPVVLLDGAQHDYWRVDETRLRAALARRPGRRLLRPPGSRP
jgi:glutaredoxin